MITEAEEVLEGMDNNTAEIAVSGYLAERLAGDLAAEAKAMIAACEYFLQQTTGEKPMQEQLAEERLAFKALNNRFQKLHLAAAVAFGGLGKVMQEMHLPEPER